MRRDEHVLKEFTKVRQVYLRLRLEQYMHMIRHTLQFNDVHVLFAEELTRVSLQVFFDPACSNRMPVFCDQDQVILQ